MWLPEDDAGNVIPLKSDPLENLSLAEILHLLFLDNDQNGGLTYRTSPFLDSAIILSLFIDLSTSSTITFKHKSIFYIFGEKQVVHLEKDSSTGNIVLDYVVERLLEDKQQLSVQEWVDLWCGHTLRGSVGSYIPWAEENVITTIKRIIINSLVTKGILKKANGSPTLLDTNAAKHQQVRGNASPFAVASALLREIFKAPSFDISAYSDEEGNHRDLRLLLSCVSIPCEVIEILFDTDKEREEAFQRYLTIRSSLMSSHIYLSDTKAMILETEGYMGLQLT